MTSSTPIAFALGAAFGHLLARVMQRVSSRAPDPYDYDGYKRADSFGDVHVHAIELPPQDVMDELWHKIRVSQRGGS